VGLRIMPHCLLHNYRFVSY